MKRAAFFDFDGTLYDGVIAFDFAYFAFKNGYLKISDLLPMQKFLYYYILDKFKVMERYKVNRKIYGSIAGWHPIHIESAAKKLFETNVRKKLFNDMLKKINWHKKKKHKIIVVTSALKQIISPLKTIIKVDDIIATEVLIKNKKYTGKIKSLPVGKNRIKVIRRYSSANKINLRESYAYSDHYSDLHFLGNVGHAVAVRPERKLRKYAIKMGWLIIDR